MCDCYLVSLYASIAMRLIRCGSNKSRTIYRNIIPTSPTVHTDITTAAGEPSFLDQVHQRLLVELAASLDLERQPLATQLHHLSVEVLQHVLDHHIDPWSLISATQTEFSQKREDGKEKTHHIPRPHSSISAPPRTTPPPQPTADPPTQHPAPSPPRAPAKRGS